MNREELFEKYYLGLLSAEESAELKRLLREDPAARADFARHTQERGVLMHLMGRGAADGGEPAASDGPAPRTEELFERYFLGTLSPGETVEVKDLLREDPAARVEFVRHMQERSVLMHLMSRGAAAAEIPEGILVEEGRRPSRISRVVPRTRRPAASSLWTPLVFAAGLLLGVVAIFAVYPASPPRSIPEARRPAPAETVARKEVERIDADRRRSLDRMAEMERQRQELLEARKAAEARAQEEQSRREAEEALARVEARLREEAATLERSREERKKAEVELTRVTPPTPAAPTVAAAALIESLEGDVLVAGKGASRGAPVRPGDGVETVGAKSRAVLSWPDGTRAELGPDTQVRDVAEQEGPGRGKRLTVAKGSLLASVTKQPSDRPMVFLTPHGQARVLGTTLRLEVKKATRLEVVEGKVRLSRPDGKGVDVASEHYAVAGPGGDLVSRPLLSRKLGEDFDTLPEWASTYDAAWQAGPAAWGITPGPSGNALAASRAVKGSSTQVLVYEVPANSTVDLSCFMRCPKLNGSYWMEFAYRLDAHTAEEFDVDQASWTLVKKFGNSGWENGNGNQWTRYATRVNTGASTRITVGFKLGSMDGAVPAVGWDSLRLSR